MTLWFVSVDKSWFAEKCDVCIYRRDFIQHRFFTLPLYSEVKEYVSMVKFVADELGVPCRHPNLERYHKVKWWGLVVPTRPRDCMVGGGTFDDAYKEQVRTRIRELIESDPNLATEFQQRVLIERNIEYWKQLRQILLPRDTPYEGN
jgi:hypothetical protein